MDAIPARCEVRSSRVTTDPGQMLAAERLDGTRGDENGDQRHRSCGGNSEGRAGKTGDVVKVNQIVAEFEWENEHLGRSDRFTNAMVSAPASMPGRESGVASPESYAVCQPERSRDLRKQPLTLRKQPDQA
jgi:hypothetical protein